MSDQVRHSAQSMFHAIKMWRAAADDLFVAELWTLNLKVSKGVEGTHGEALSSYLPAPDYFRDRFREGIQVCRDIATVLEEAMEQYAATDEEFAAEIRRKQAEL